MGDKEDTITPRTLIRDYIHNAPTEERSTRRRRNVSAPQKNKEVKKDVRLSQSYTTDKVSKEKTESHGNNKPRQPTPSSIGRSPRRSSRKTPMSVHKKAIMAHFLQSQNKTKADEPTPRTMIRALMGQVNEETPLMATRSQAAAHISSRDESVSSEISLHQNKSSLEDTFLQVYNKASQESRPSPKKLKRKRQEVSNEAFSQGVSKKLRDRRARKEQTSSENSHLLESVMEESLQASQLTFDDSVKSSVGRSKSSAHIGSMGRGKRSAKSSQEESLVNVSSETMRLGQSVEEDSFLKAYETASQQEKQRTSSRKSKRQRREVSKDAFSEVIGSVGRRRQRQQNKTNPDMTASLRSIREDKNEVSRNSLGKNTQSVIAEIHVSPPDVDDIGVSKNAANVQERLSNYKETSNSESGSDVLKRPIPLTSYDASGEASEEDGEGEGHFHQKQSFENMASEHLDTGPNDIDGNTERLVSDKNVNDQNSQRNEENDEVQKRERTGVGENQDLEGTINKEAHQMSTSQNYTHRKSSIGSSLNQLSMNYSAKSSSSLQKSSFGQYGGYSPLVTPVLPPGNPFLKPTPKPATKQTTIDVLFGAAKSSESTKTNTEKTTDKETTKKPTKKKTPPKKSKNDEKPLRLPSSLTKSISQHFTHGRMSKETLATIESVTDDFFKNVTSDLEAFAHHADRMTVDARDVELLMKRQGFVTKNQSMFTLVEKYLPLEYQQEIIPVARSGNKVVPKDFH